MADHRNADAKGQSGVPSSKPSQAVGRTIQAVVSDIERRLDPTLLRNLKDAAMSPDMGLCKTVVAEALADGTSAEELADFYIPAISRDLGDLWCEDQLSFAGVTIGVSRLQGILRDLGPNWSGDSVMDPLAPIVLLIVPHEVYHTIGAIILSGQLRRRGISVRLVLGERANNIAQRLQRTRYDAVFISASQSESLETLRRIIDVVKNASQAPTPAIIGGGILEVETHETVTAVTGADYATGNTDEALRFCGIKAETLDTLAIKNGA